MERRFVNFGEIDSWYDYFALLMAQRSIIWMKMTILTQITLPSKTVSLLQFLQ